MAVMSAGALMSYAEKIALNAVCLNIQSLAAGTTYLALITNAPTQTDQTMAAETEFATATAYARQPIAVTTGWTGGGATTASPSVISNALTLTYGPFTSAPGICTWAILTDAVAVSTAHCIAAFLLTNPRTPLTGDSLTASSASFSITL